MRDTWVNGMSAMALAVEDFARRAKTALKEHTRLHRHQALRLLARTKIPPSMGVEGSDGQDASR